MQGEEKTGGDKEVEANQKNKISRLKTIGLGSLHIAHGEG